MQRPILPLYSRRRQTFQGVADMYGYGRIKKAWPSILVPQFCFAVAILTIAFGVSYRQELIALLPVLDFEQMNELLKAKLERLDNAGITGLIAYTTMLWLWTMIVGITTPIETAAGFCFGAKKAILVSAIGKMGGALTSFFLGRYIFHDRVQDKLHNNELLQLVDESISERPFLVALMTRLSPVPEIVKNFGMSILDIPATIFILSVLLHGISFTCLWSCLGAETAKVALHRTSPSTGLKAMVTGTTWFCTFASLFSFRCCCCCKWSFELYFHACTVSNTHLAFPLLRRWCFDANVDGLVDELSAKEETT
jgi:uncharacterized membrane protein YdjX (TVP38/TMEM64 family)